MRPIDNKTQHSNCNCVIMTYGGQMSTYSDFISGGVALLSKRVTAWVCLSRQE